MQNTPSQIRRPVDWAHVRPVLDEALAELDQRDREAILLRYMATVTSPRSARGFRSRRTRPGCACGPGRGQVALPAGPTPAPTSTVAG